jgi:hypothetical protein
MKLSKLIRDAQKILDKQGDLEVFDTDTCSLESVKIEVAVNFPEDWNFTEGEKFVRIE